MRQGHCKGHIAAVSRFFASPEELQLTLVRVRRAVKSNRMTGRLWKHCLRLQVMDLIGPTTFLASNKDLTVAVELRDQWIQVCPDPEDIIHLISQSDMSSSQHIVLGNPSDPILMILHPESLISCTTVVSTAPCLRRAVLDVKCPVRFEICFEFIDVVFRIYEGRYLGIIVS